MGSPRAIDEALKLGPQPGLIGSCKGPLGPLHVMDNNLHTALRGLRTYKDFRALGGSEGPQRLVMHLNGLCIYSQGP